VAAGVSRERLKAQMNAQLGARIALGELQKLAGPDQRVTARSDVLLAPAVSAAEGQRYFGRGFGRASCLLA
jgi:hypothetical protein